MAEVLSIAGRLVQAEKDIVHAHKRLDEASDQVASLLKRLERVEGDLGYNAPPTLEKRDLDPVAGLGPVVAAAGSDKAPQF
jgi:hypothetical protein